MSENDEEARMLAGSLFSSLSRPVRINLPVERRNFRDWLQQIGLREQGVRAEMASGAARLPWQVPQRFALASQAWG